MRRLAASPLNLLLVLLLGTVSPQQAFGPGAARPAGATQAPVSDPVRIPLDLFQVPDGLEVTLWAASPMLHNPTNIDIDRDGRIWVAEGVRYRSHHARRPEGDRIVVLQDTDGDGKADSTHTFVQEPALIAPLGVSVIDNKIVVAQPPDLLVYTDVDRNLRFDPAIDTREVLLTGFQGINHDHSLHSVTVGPDGKWIFNAGNMGAMFTDRSGRTFRVFSAYRPNPVGPFKFPHDPAEHAGKPSDDGHVYVGGFTVRMNADGTGAEIIGHNYRNSYEQSVTSLGDVFQNDNDDPPACRVSWVMEYANFGFSSNDGQRTWQADRRPGQSIPVAEWRQEDPGITPAGDVYGGGSPTGNVFYENGVLGPSWQGTFFAAEPGRNEVFSYQPVPEGAGFRLDRRIFLTSNVKRDYAGSDFLGGNRSVTGAIHTLFRPSDIAVGPDGALYVSDWIDARVGGHQDLDDTVSGAIYRIAPKGFVPKAPAFDPSTIDGLITALRSPAVNVRAIGFEGLKARGASAVSAVAELLKDPNPYIKGRAIFLLYQLGPEGRKQVESPEMYADPALKIAAYRAMRRAGLDVLPVASMLARDADPGVRREIALSMRDVAADKSLHILVDIARGYDGKDRTYLEAFGTGATGKEPALYERLRRELGVKDDPLTWSGPFARIAWRLHVPAAVTDLTARARSTTLPDADRRLAMDTLAFIRDPAASKAMLALVEPESPLREGATWWLLNRMSNDWAEHGLRESLRIAGIYDPDAIVLREAVVPPAPADLPKLDVDEILRLTGDAGRGRTTATRCLMCHAIGGTGAELGPALDGWGQGKSAEVIAIALVDPNAEIAHGYDGTEIRTKDGLTIQGVLIKQGDPLMMRSMGGVTQIIPADRVATRRRMPDSLMMSAAQLGLTAQDVADLVAFLRAN
ncbi:MAG TPA: PVC-type heme-binding CxxCH protein [Vicinamibacterales bacterium]|nr:PVC-type heme-binding CxxCH protein [Vicinamibacterales bacterium]